MKKNVIKDKSYAFALKIVKLTCGLVEKKEYVLSKQLLRSATSVGANVEEADGGFSKKDFIYKIQISLKEAKESHYWLRLLRDAGYVDSEEANNLIKDCEELIYIIVAILRKSKGK